MHHLTSSSDQEDETMEPWMKGLLIGTMIGVVFC